jgi:hypothetical protein
MNARAAGTAVILIVTVASGFSRNRVSGAATATGRSAQTRDAAQRVPQFANERAIAWKSIIPPHSESSLHRHDRFRTVIAIVGGDLKIVTAAAEATVTRYETGRAYWQAPMPQGVMHKDVNDTDKTIELVVVEMK